MAGDLTTTTVTEEWPANGDRVLRIETKFDQPLGCSLRVEADERLGKTWVAEHFRRAIRAGLEDAAHAVAAEVFLAVYRHLYDRELERSDSAPITAFDELP